MRTRQHWGFQLFVSCLLRPCPRWPSHRRSTRQWTDDSVGSVDKRGIAPTRGGPRSRRQGSRISVEHGTPGPQRPAGTISLPADHHQPGRPTDRLRRPPQQPEAAHQSADRQNGSEWDVDRRRNRPGQDPIPHIPTGEDRRTGGAQMVRVCSGNTLPRAVKGKWYLLRPLGGSAPKSGT